MYQLFAFHIFCVLVLANGLKNEKYILKRSVPSLMDSVRLTTLKTVDDLWQDLTKLNDGNHKAISDMDILRVYEKIHKNITEVESSINPSDFFLFSSDWSYAQVDAEVSSVNIFYETFVRFQREQLTDGRKPPIAWTDLAETYLQPSDFGVIKSLEKIHRYTATKIESENLFKKVTKEIKSNSCNLKQSPHQTLYNLYNAVSLAQLKGFTIVQFSYMLLNLYNKGNFTKEAQFLRSKYDERVTEQMDVARTALMTTDRSAFRCDPKQYVEGVTYTKLINLLQGYIENEVNLNPYGTCSENCAYYQFTEYNGCFKNQFCAKQPPCLGKVVECRFMNSDMNICTSSTPDRRYDWIEYENGLILGNKGVCERKNFFKVDSWWRYLFWHCSYCLCYCDDNQNSDRYFSLRRVTSDIEHNKILTGVRIVKNNQIIHLQIQQGTLAPRGMVDKQSLSWKPVDNFTVDDHNVENNVDYHTLSWLERSLDIDEVIAPPEHVVTGVRFRKVGTHLNLEIRVTPINFATGKLLKADYSYWMGNDNTDGSLEKPRSEIKLINPDIPIRKGPHSIDAVHDQYVQFQSTSFETDAGQSTVPYLDTQALTSQGFILSGLGLVHRGKIGSGGFVAPKLISYDFTQHLNDDQ